MMAPALCGLVLAGGSSRRMGQDKAAITNSDGKSWLESTVAMLEPLCSEVYVSCQHSDDDPLRSRFPCILDDGPSEGPLTGITSAHRRFPQNRWLVLAVDLPNMIPEALARIIRHAETVSTIATSSRGLEPLCGVYCPELLAALTTAFRAGERSVLRGLEANRKCYTTVALDDVSLMNINRPSDREQ